MNLGALRRYCDGAAVVARAVARRDAGRRRSSACCRASSSRSSSPCCCSSAATGGRTARCSAAPTTARAGTASTTSRARREEPGIVVYRWEAPLFFANAGTFREQIRRARAGRGSPAGSCCSARPSPTSTSPRPSMLEQLDDELNAAGMHMAFVEMRSRLQDLVGATACTTPSTATTSTPASTPRSPPSRRTEETGEDAGAA